MTWPAQAATLQKVETTSDINMIYSFPLFPDPHAVLNSSFNSALTGAKGGYNWAHIPTRGRCPAERGRELVRPGEARRALQEGAAADRQGLPGHYRVVPRFGRRAQRQGGGLQVQRRPPPDLQLHGYRPEIGRDLRIRRFRAKDPFIALCCERILFSILSLCVLLFITFLLSHVVAGDPAIVAAGPNAGCRQDRGRPAGDGPRPADAGAVLALSAPPSSREISALRGSRASPSPTIWCASSRPRWNSSSSRC